MYSTFDPERAALTDCNETGARFLGYEPAELVGVVVFDLFPAEDRERLYADYLRYRRDGELRDARYRIRHRDGRELPVSITVWSVRDADGRIVEGRAVMRDIADTARAEWELERSEQRFRRLAETISLVPWEADADTVGAVVEQIQAPPDAETALRWSQSASLSWIGPQVEALLGFPPERFQEPGFWLACVHPGDRERLLASAAALITGGDAHDFEYRMIASDGRVVWVLDSVSVIRERDGRIGLVGVMADVSERTEAAVQQADLMRQLDHRVKDALATVRAVAERTRATSATMDEFRRTFGRRLRTLARVHDALAERQWQEMTVAQLAQAVLGDHAEVRGPEVPVPLAATRALGLALGELAAGAVRPALDWEHGVEPGHACVRLRWREPGDPARPALDRYLVEDALAYELDARVALRVDASGVACDVEIPLLD